MYVLNVICDWRDYITECKVEVFFQAIDVFMATCITFVFLALVEFALVNVLTRSDEKPKGKTPEKSTPKWKVTTVSPISDVSNEDVSVCIQISH